MKKAYSKPMITFESFTLSTNIAAGCERIVGNPSKGTCGIMGSDGETLFSGFCDVDWMSKYGDDYDGFCYHVPFDNNNLFNS